MNIFLFSVMLMLYLRHSSLIQHQLCLYWLTKPVIIKINMVTFLRTKKNCLQLPCAGHMKAVAQKVVIDFTGIFRNMHINLPP
jgi:hypothetical protein